ncbi:hypothetical protein G6F24_014301 [Rhizopus arrhizus]|nr:hypothetical protein G6F24_014301 [Rhizopus arrhizus]
MVKACSRPRTVHALAAKVEVVRKSLAERRAGSIPASGTNLEAVPASARAASTYGVSPSSGVSTMERQPPNASTGGASAQFGYYPKPCDIVTGRFSIQTLTDHESRVAVVTGDSNVLKDWIYPGAQQHRDFMSGNVRSMPYNAQREPGRPRFRGVVLVLFHRYAADHGRGGLSRCDTDHAGEARRLFPESLHRSRRH